MRRFVSFFMLLSMFGLAACSSEEHFTYTPTTAVVRSGPPVISTVTAIDQRKESPHRLATIMGGFGNPLKVLDTTNPVADEVAAEFGEGLDARGLLSKNGQGPVRMELTIRKCDADMIMGSTARIDMDLHLVSTATGQSIYEDTIVDKRSDFHFIATGIFASTDDLMKLAQTLLDATVDGALDKPEFRAALGGAYSAKTGQVPPAAARQNDLMP